jgi:[ribosomal protein S5]-alanine N-acetyltransferase
MNLGGWAELRLATPRLRLRPLVPADAPALFGIFADPVVMRHWSTPPWTELAQGLAMVARDQAGLASGEHLRLGLELADSPGVIGQCTLFDIDAGSRRAEVGYALARRAWGQGLMHEALCALLDFGFGPVGLNRVEADIDPRNQASAHSLLRLGFQAEGLLRERWIVAGEVSDSAIYGLLQREWQARRAAG